MTTMNTLALSGLDKETASNGNSLLMVMQQLSMSLGVSVGAFLLNKYTSVEWISTPNSLNAFRYSFITMGAITILSAGIFFRLQKTDGDNLTGVLPK